MKKKNILVLATFDERVRGHGWSQYQRFKELGHNVQFLCLLRTLPDTPKECCIIDSLSKLSIRYMWYKLWRTLEKVMFAPFPSMRAMYKGVDFASSKDILKRLQQRPDLIVVCIYQYFLSPHSLYNIYKETKSEMCFIMVDEKILGGGCPYPKYGCNQYVNGCKDCPYYPYGKFIPQKVYQQKSKYFSRFPFHVIGTNFDIRQAQKVSFLHDKIMHGSVANPPIPFVLTKEEARKKMNLPLNDYIILSGAVNINDWKKGFKELLESLKIFSKKITNDRQVSFVILSKKQQDYDLPQSIKVLQLGFLDLEGLFTAFYASDVFVSPSIMDSGPMMVNYSIACGRPVVAFPVGVAQDLIVHQETGWMAERRDTTDYAKGLEYFYTLNSNSYSQVENTCKKHIKQCSDNCMDNFRRIFAELVTK